MTPLQKAYAYGQYMAKEAFEKEAISPTALGLYGIGGAMGASAAPEGEALGGGLGAMGGMHLGAKGYHALARRGLTGGSSKTRGLAALAALLGGGYAGSHAGRAAQRGLEDKTGEAALGDPNYWQGGTPSPEEEAAAAAPPPPQNAEEAVQMLPAGTFQGAQIKIQPDGVRNTTVKVTPDAVAQPDGLAGIFQAEPGAKVEISQPEQEAVPGGGQAPGGAMPPPGMEGMPPEGMPPEGMPPAEAGKMAALRQLGLIA